MTVEFNGKIYELEQDAYGTNNGSNTYEALAHEVGNEDHHVMVVWDVINPEAEMDSVCDWDNPSDVYKTEVD